MSIWQAVFLGILQGVAEFLPISSSGHLVLAQHLLGIPEVGVAFDTFLHLATLLAVVVFFWGDLANLVRRREWRAFWLIVVGSIPAGLVGVLFQDFFASLFQSVLVVGVALLITGTILYFADRFGLRGTGRRTWQQMTWWDALAVGVAQAVAIVPGISRSGSTLSAGLFSGLERGFAARYSFFLSIPVVAGAGVLELKDLSAASLTQGWLPLLLGFITAFAAGLWAIRFLLRLLAQEKLRVFAYYTWVAGAAVILWQLLI